MAWTVHLVKSNSPSKNFVMAILKDRGKASEFSLQGKCTQKHLSIFRQSSSGNIEIKYKSNLYKNIQNLTFLIIQE